MRDALAWANDAGRTIETRGGGTKASMGRPGRAHTVLDMSAFAAVIDYDPRELVLTVGAGARLTDVEDVLATENQMLAFEPFDHGPIFGLPAGQATVGGIVAANVSGSRRLSAGSVRDHVLGFEGVSGRGEIFKGGGRVVKNVTGYDLPKLLTGSWGRLAALTAITFKVLPRPRVNTTVILRNLSDENAATVMAQAMGSAAEVSGAAHTPALAGRPATTALRLEGFETSVTARVETLRSLQHPHGAIELLEMENSRAFWRRLRDLEPLDAGNHDWLLWQINGRPTTAWKAATAFAVKGARWFSDWAGGLIWLAVPPGTDPMDVRHTVARAGGHATLIRARETVRAKVPLLHPQPFAVEALAARVKAAFDPNGILDPDRFAGSES